MSINRLRFKNFTLNKIEEEKMKIIYQAKKKYDIFKKIDNKLVPKAIKIQRK